MSDYSERVVLGAQPLDAGEKRVLGGLDQRLEPDWRIYAQPRIGGCRPDFLCTHPIHGVVIVEVKSWMFDDPKRHFSLALDPGHGRPVITHFSGPSTNGETADIEDPVRQLERYDAAVETALGVKATSSLLVFANGSRAMSSAIGRAIVDHRQRGETSALPIEVASREWADIEWESVVNAFSVNRWPQPVRVSEDLIEFVDARLTSWTRAQEAVPTPKGKAREIINNTAQVRTRWVDGSAGSGKSLIACARAAVLSKAGTKVLLTYHTMSLHLYLMDLLVQFDADLSLVELKHFHAWLSEQRRNAGLPYRAVEGDDRSLERRVIDSWVDSPDKRPNLGAVIVDENQDFSSDGLEVLIAGVGPEIELLALGDSKQDIFANGSASTWPTAKGRRHGGRPTTIEQLEAGYRMPEALDAAVRNLESTDIGYQDCGPIQRNLLDRFTAHCCSSDDELASRAVDAVQKVIAMHDPDAISPPRILVVTSRRDSAIEIAAALAKSGIASRCGVDPGADRLAKSAFTIGTDHVAVTTIASGKGWESEHVIAVVDQPVNYRRSIYVAASRTRQRRSDTVGCSLDLVLGPRVTPRVLPWLDQHAEVIDRADPDARRPAA